MAAAALLHLNKPLRHDRRPCGCVRAGLVLWGSFIHLQILVSSPRDEEGRGADYIPSYGESLFHVLTCLERYLAVVRPIIYLRLRNVQGVRIRNISIGLSVLCVLIRPGPGNGERVDQSKQSAFYTVTAITAALWLLGPRITKALCGVPLFTVRTCCAMMSSLVSYNVPCSLASPLLFLHTDTIVVLL
ncbi:hypothetical protein JOQ06_014712 [Pogonophryne albipinna]|uniref:Uncharacterized protein n=1 Tax=Pogonophryne albipinna TaxID=1090488 RepID=A0AAD6ALD9_9TELE|nr:hypothetical protein JOQ06_014712 [Pogonophryne albipinna]